MNIYTAYVKIYIHMHIYNIVYLHTYLQIYIYYIYTYENTLWCFLNEILGAKKGSTIYLWMCPYMVDVSLNKGNALRKARLWIPVVCQRWPSGRVKFSRTSFGLKSAAGSLNLTEAKGPFTWILCMSFKKLVQFIQPSTYGKTVFFSNFKCGLVWTYGKHPRSG